MAAQRMTQTFEQIDAAAIHRGMNVYSRNGEALGVVSEVWAYVPQHGLVAKSRFGLADYGPIRGTMHLFAGADGYVQVAPRRGLRRENEQDLYIPLGAIHDTVPGESLIVQHTSQACAERFAQPPADVSEAA